MAPGMLIVAGVILLLAAPFLKGMMPGLRTSKGVKKTLPPEPLVEVKLVGLSDPAPLPDIELSRDFLTIRSIDFFGQGARSPNDKYMVGSQMTGKDDTPMRHKSQAQIAVCVSF